MNNKVLIYSALGMGTWVLAQSILLSGRVLDETSVPVEGASVQLVNQSLKTQTLGDGSFTLVNLVDAIQANTQIGFKGDLLSIQLPQMEIVRIAAINSKGQSIELINQNFSAGALNLSLQRMTQSLVEGSYILQISTPSIQAQYRILKHNQVSLRSDHAKFAKQDLDTLWISKQGYTDTKIPLQSYEQALGDLTLLSISSSSILSSSSVFSSSVLSSSVASSSSVAVSSSVLSSSVLSSALSSSVSLSSMTLSSSSLSSSLVLSSALSSSSAPSSSSIQKLSQTISFAPIPDQLLSVQRINVTATASSNLVVGFSSLTQNICSLTGNLVSFLGAGVCTISADQSGNTQYLAAPMVSRSFTITAPLSSSVMSSSALSSSSILSSSSVLSSSVLSSSVASSSSVISSSSNMCTGISSWNSTLNYAVANTQVVHNNSLWYNKWYSVPNEEPGVYSVWVKVSDCNGVLSSSSVLSSSALSSSVVSSSLLLSSITSSSSSITLSSVTLSSSSVVVSSVTPSSSSVVLSSSSTVTCTATPVANYYFNFTQGNTMLAGHQIDNTIFQANEWVVPVGVDCNQAQQISSVSGWNLYLVSGWNGVSGTRLGIAKVTGPMTPSSSSVTSSSSVLSSSSQSSSSSGTGTGLGAWFTKSQFDALFAKRNLSQCISDGNGIYTYENFIAAANRWPSFGTTGDEITRKKELAGVFAHFVQETGSNTADPTTGLCWVKERCAVSGSCLNSYNQDFSGQYPPQPGKYYYGRGPKQLSWPGNYGWMSQEVYGDKMILLNNPDLITTDGIKAFESALWFWNQRSEYWASPATPTLHAVMTQGAVLKGHRGFEATTFSVNGDLECSAGNQGMMNRAANYLYFQRALGIPEASLDQSNLYCTFK